MEGGVFQLPALIIIIIKLLAMYLQYVTNSVDTDFINDMIYHNNIDMVGACITVKHFTEFLYKMKNFIGEIIGKDYFVEVYNSIDYTDKWSFDKCDFGWSEHGDLKKLSHNEYSVTVRLTYKYFNLSTVRIHSEWARTCKEVLTQVTKMF